MNSECKICAKPLKGRSDKIFCSTQCKNQYHKKIRHATKVAAIEINGYLKRNYTILLEVLGKNKSQVKIYRNLLVKKGFRFKYHTHFQVNSKNKMYHYIYDLAWMEFSDDTILVIRKR
ncbi:hypothetical protein [Aequorivita marina]|uniref:hypothetical protein n=1 Tax=Aequorivita marina TaxID=3073654 RepID=UPI002876DA8D|nr:hypothetical protein [Aequorivita sp. S2608]MDS1299319.1 hypothetical protein [Aequorivita sp. S2608]